MRTFCMMELRIVACAALLLMCLCARAEPTPAPSPGSNLPSPPVMGPGGSPPISSPPSPAPSPTTPPVASPPKPDGPSPSPSQGFSSSPPLSQTPPPAESGPLRATWCVVGDKEMQKCGDLTSAIASSTKLGELAAKVTWDCVQMDRAYDCMQAIKNKNADLTVLEAGLAFFAFAYMSMKAVLVEVDQLTAQPFYQTVAVVTQEACNKNDLSLADFKGGVSCHPAYENAGGWDIPLYNLAAKGLVTPFNVDPVLQNDLEMMKSFFTQSCAPSDTDGQRLCGLCQSLDDAGRNGAAADSDPCATTHKYGGYEGAFRCLVETTKTLKRANVIAFLRDGVVNDFQTNGGPKAQPWSNTLQAGSSSFRLLCPQGGCHDIGATTNCTWGDVTSNSVMVRNQADPARVAAIREVLMAMTDDPKVSSMIVNGNSGGAIFSSYFSRLVNVTRLTRTHLGTAGVRAQWVDVNVNVDTPVGTLPGAAFHGSSPLSASMIAATSLLALTVLWATGRQTL